MGELFSTKKYMLAMGEGLKTTFIITFSALAIGLVIGMIISFVKIAATRNKKMRIIISLIKYIFTMKVALNAYSIHDNFSLMSVKVQALWR